MSKKTFHFERIQRGRWGETVVSKKPIKVKAKSLDDAHLVINQRRDSGKRLQNGDRIVYAVCQVD